jgi:hypothetical protein
MLTGSTVSPPTDTHRQPTDLAIADSQRVGYFPRMGNRAYSSEDDPLKLDPVDREIRIEKLKQQLRQIAGGDVTFGQVSRCDPAVQEAFLEHVLAFESQEGVRPLDVLTRDGFDLPPPELLGDQALSAKLWELIRVLAARHMFLDRTDHLSDRELYIWLRDDALRQEYTGFGVPPGNWHVDVLGGCSEEDLILAMRYYADDEERARWAAEFPDFPMPHRQPPPYDRDRHLPQPYPPM